MRLRCVLLLSSLALANSAFGANLTAGHVLNQANISARSKLISFQENWSRYPSPDVIVAKLRQDFPLVDASKLGLSECQVLTSANRSLLGDSQPATGAPAIDLPNSSFVNWYAGCVADFIKNEGSSATNSDDDNFKILNGELTAELCINDSRAAQENAYAAKQAQWNLNKEIYLKNFDMKKLSDKEKKALRARAESLFDFAKVERPKAQELKYCLWSDLSPESKIKVISLFLERYIGPEDVIVDLGLAESENALSATIRDYVDRFNANPDETFNFLLYFKPPKDGLSATQAVSIIKMLIHLEDINNFRTPMKRREFLQSAQSLLLLAAAGGVPGLTLFSPRVLAQEPQAYRGKYFVMIRVGTGWDVTLGLDPKVHADGSEQKDMFIEYRPDEILQSGNLRLAPACAPLTAHAQDLSVINGVFMSNANVSHDANLDYMSTGDGEGHVADLPVEIAHASDAGPFGVVFTRSLKRSNRTVMPTTVDNIVSMANSLDFDSLGGFLSLLKSNGAFHQAEKSLAQNSPIRASLLAAMKSQDAKINQPANGGTNNGGNGTDVNAAVRAGAVLSAAFISGAAYQGLIDVQTDLDTHSGHEGKHLRNQTAVWDAVAQIFSIFKNVPAGERSLFDRTTFMVISEFARTPALNASGGKDHNPLTNSVLLAGAGIQGGSSIGQSHLIKRQNSKTGEPTHVAGPIDYITGASAANIEEARKRNFQFIFPENVAATVAEAVGVDRGKFASARPDTASLNAILRKA